MIREIEIKSDNENGIVGMEYTTDVESASVWQIAAFGLLHAEVIL